MLFRSPRLGVLGASVTGSLSVTSDTYGISGGNNHYCFIKPDSTVECIGDNTNGQLNVPV